MGDHSIEEAPFISTDVIKQCKIQSIKAWQNFELIATVKNMFRFHDARNPSNHLAGLLFPGRKGQTCQAGTEESEHIFNNSYKGEHSYYFRLYGLDIALDLPEGATKKEVASAMEGHILEKAVLMGRYERV